VRRIEKTVFISYRRTNSAWALAVFKDLTQHGFDVFFDYTGIASGDFEQVILENIRARAHFIVLLSPSALDRCTEPGDWLRREIEEAIRCDRNIVPLMLEGFDFGAPKIVSQLTGELASLKRYNGLSVPMEYFDAAMGKLRDKFLNVPLEALDRLPSEVARTATNLQQIEAIASPQVRETELKAQEWFERGCAADDLNEQDRCYSEAIQLKPDYADAYCNRGLVRRKKNDLEGALQDLDEAIRLTPDDAVFYINRGAMRYSAKHDLDGALRDLDEAIRLRSDSAKFYTMRGIVRRAKGDQEGALRDLTEVIRLEPDNGLNYHPRMLAHWDKGNYFKAAMDFASLCWHNWYKEV